MDKIEAEEQGNVDSIAIECGEIMTMDEDEDPLVTYLNSMCEENGYFQKVGPEHYLAFLMMTERESLSMIRFVFREELRLMRAFGPRETRKTKKDILKNIHSSLRFIFLGRMRFNDDYSLGLVKPQGPAPDNAMERGFRIWVTRSAGVIMEVYDDYFQVKESSS